MNNFSDNIKALRNKLNLTQKDFAEKIQVTAPTLNAYEKGTKKPNFDTLIKIAQEFNLSLDELCGINKSTEMSKIKTYSDIFKIILQVKEHTDVFSHLKIDKDVWGEELLLTTRDDFVIDFVKEYEIMLSLKEKGSVSNNIFNEWLSSKFKRYGELDIEAFRMVYSSPRDVNEEYDLPF